MTKEEAAAAYRKLIMAHGLHWGPNVPSSAHDEIVEINKILSEKDRRVALGLLT